MGDSANIVVAGAGAVGSTIALKLARAGHRVSVVDPAPEASASAVAAGMLAPGFEALFDAASEGRFELFRAARDLWPELAAGIGLELDRAGAMAVGDAAEVAGWAARLEGLGASAQVLTASEASAAAPWLASAAAAVATPDDWRLEPRAALVALRRAAEAQGVSFPADRVAGFESGRALLASGDVIAAEALVIATGAGRELVEVAPALAGLTPIKGHILRAPSETGAGQVVRGAGVYLCPSADGLVLGASMEDGRGDLGIDPAVVSDLIRRAARLSPRLGDLDWRPQTGVRAATADGLPLAGEVAPGVVLAVGARRNGWLLAPLIAETVADAVARRPRSAAATLFDPVRTLVSPG